MVEAREGFLGHGSGWEPAENEPVGAAVELEDGLRHKAVVVVRDKMLGHGDQTVVFARVRSVHYDGGDDDAVWSSGGDGFERLSCEVRDARSEKKTKSGGCCEATIFPRDHRRGYRENHTEPSPRCYYGPGENSAPSSMRREWFVTVGGVIDARYRREEAGSFSKTIVRAVAGGVRVETCKPC